MTIAIVYCNCLNMIKSAFQDKHYNVPHVIYIYVYLYFWYKPLLKQWYTDNKLNTYIIHNKI